VKAPSRKPPKRPLAEAEKHTVKPARRTSGRCPICGKPASRDNRPFCSKRCAEIDLGRWLKGGYAVPGEPLSKTSEEPE
jgi:uncharacterized protein